VAELDLTFMQRLAERAKLAGRGGGSDDGGMLEQRVAALEADMRDVKSILARMEPVLRAVGDGVQRLDKRMDGVDDRLRRLELETAEMKGKVSQLPTAWTFISAGIGLVLGTFGFVFALLRFVIPR
jgi:hypothetical protein